MFIYTDSKGGLELLSFYGYIECTECILTSNKGEVNMNQRYCKECGNELLPESVFCSHCGQKIEQENSPVQQQTAVQQQPVFWKKYKWAVVGIGVISLILIIFLVQKDDPEKVAEKFVEHVGNAEIDKAYDLMTVEAGRDFRDDFEDMLEFYDGDKEEARRDMLENVDIRSFEISDVEKLSKNDVEITGDVYYGDGDEEQIIIEITKENGKWKVKDTY